MKPLKSIGATSVLALSLIALAGCEGEVSFGDKTIDNEEAERTISDALAEQYGSPPKSMSCPEDVEAVDGGTFTCTGESPENPPRPFEIEVTMTDDSGGIRYPTTVTFTDGSGGDGSGGGAAGQTGAGSGSS